MRIPGKGITDGAPTVTITLDGRQIIARQGETLAATLVANDIRLVGRSFKYHRPRGLLTAGSEEPNALYEIGPDATRTPNTRATVQEVFDGLTARSQNRFPSLSFDLMAVNDWLHPFLGAGFYYKTFMWPRAFWEGLYEPLIRRAAGLGRLARTPVSEAYEKAWAHCDLLVIGAGPAGLMAARTAARAGADVILADEQSAPGGRLLDEDTAVDGIPARQWVAQVLAELSALSNVRVMTRTTVTGAYDQGTYGALERVARHVGPSDAPRDCFWRIVARRAILCAGAIERPLAFPDNDRPGIMMASGLRSYLHRWGVAPSGRVTVIGCTDDAHRTARDLAAAGLRVAALIDTRPGLSVAPADYPVLTGGRILRTEGRLGLRRITVAHDGGQRMIETETLAMSGGWNPTLHLTCHMGGRPVWRDDIAAFVPQDDAVPGLTVAGSARGIWSTAACLADGLAAAHAALSDLSVNAPDDPVPVAEDAPATLAIPAPWRGKSRAWLDFANDVTTKDVAQSAAEGFASVEHMKRYTTQGMAPDQGKNSNVAALMVLADATGRSVQDTGTTTFRPPFSPVPIAAMGAGGQGAGFAPIRRTTSDAAARARGAPMVEAGLWYRASYFPRPGEASWRDACDREVAMVRATVGVCDVSTLGKIDVQGPDAAAFLDLLYTGRMSTLAPGRVRYGLMLREDGHVMDDGTVACLAPGHYVLTTTTAAAALVMRHIEIASQGIAPHLDVQAVSVTEQWAQFSVAGPRSRDLIAQLTDAPDLPYMGCRPARILGQPGRLFRISFSGERAYEVAVPARHGAALWQMLVALSETLGGGAYGMEALNVLRIEKGLLTHAELHGRTTAFDLGLQRMLKRDGDFIGRALAARPGLIEDTRDQLVGLRPLSPDGRLTAGAHLFDDGAAPVRVNDRGYVTSACHSPTLGHDIALAFLSQGRARIGQTIRAVDALRGLDTPCTVCDPVFLDPDGGRLRD